MALKKTEVSRCLDKKVKICGFEVPDLLAICVLAGILHILFGQSAYPFFLVWVPTATLGLFLYFVKRGKPDNYLTHLVKFELRPGILSAHKQSSSKNKGGK